MFPIVRAAGERVDDARVHGAVQGRGAERVGALGVEMRGRDLQLTQATKLILSYIAIDANGKVRGGNTDALTMANMRPETKARIEQTGLRILNRLDLPPGKYQFRVAAHDSGGGNVGSVLMDLDVPDFLKSPFSVSGLTLTSGAGSQMPTVHPDEQLKQVLPGPAIALRSFPQNDEVTLFAEVYDNAGDKPHRVDIAASVITDEGKVMFTANEVRDSTELGGKSGGYGYTTKILNADYPHQPCPSYARSCRPCDNSREQQCRV
jgi:hypothetical protein